MKYKAYEYDTGELTEWTNLRKAKSHFSDRSGSWSSDGLGFWEYGETNGRDLYALIWSTSKENDEKATESYGVQL